MFEGVGCLLGPHSPIVPDDPTKIEVVTIAAFFIVHTNEVVEIGEGERSWPLTEEAPDLGWQGRKQMRAIVAECQEASIALAAKYCTGLRVGHPYVDLLESAN